MESIDFIHGRTVVYDSTVCDNEGFCLKKRFRRSSIVSGESSSRLSPAKLPAASNVPIAPPMTAHDATATGSERAVVER